MPIAMQKNSEGGVSMPTTATVCSIVFLRSVEVLCSTDSFSIGQPRRHVMVEGDLRRPDELRTWIEEEECIDFDKPVGLIVTGTMQLEQRNRQEQEVGPDALRHFAGRLAAGSCMAVSHVTNETRTPDDEAAAALLEDIKTVYNNTAIGAVLWRPKAEIESLLGADYQPVEGGWAPAELWGQEYTGAGAPDVPDLPETYPLVWAGVGRKE